MLMLSRGSFWQHEGRSETSLLEYYLGSGTNRAPRPNTCRSLAPKGHKHSHTNSVRPRRSPSAKSSAMRLALPFRSHRALAAKVLAGHSRKQPAASQGEDDLGGGRGPVRICRPTTWFLVGHKTMTKFEGQTRGLG